MCYALNTGLWYVTNEWFLIVNDDNVFPKDGIKDYEMTWSMQKTLSLETNSF